MTAAEKEAKAKEGTWVRVGKDDDDFLRRGVPKGALGQIAHAQLLDPVEGSTQEEAWVFNVRFYPRHALPEGILIENLSKEQYENLLKEEHGNWK